MRLRRDRVLGWLIVLTSACVGQAASHAPSPAPSPEVGRADIGGYSLAYECRGTGSPTVLLEAGYTASGLDTFGTVILPTLARTTKICTYDRAGDGLSDPRPAAVTPVTSTTQARELHDLLDGIGAAPPYVVVGHSYGGMVVRAFAAIYPTEIGGMVLIDASSEPEIRVYDRLHAGPWIDGTVTPATNQRIDIHASVRALERAPTLRVPLVVITAGILEDPWLRTVPTLEARAQTRLAGLSSDSVHVLDKDTGHFIPESDPMIVVDAVDAVVSAARTSGRLAPCTAIFSGVGTATCLAPGELGKQRTS